MKMPTHEFRLELKDLNQMAKEYCHSENKKNCEIFKKFEKDEEVSPYLFPDGRIVKK